MLTSSMELSLEAQPTWRENFCFGIGQYGSFFLFFFGRFYDPTLELFKKNLEVKPAIKVYSSPQLWDDLNSLL